MTKFEIVSEIVTVTSILIKTDREDITMKRDVFIAFLNELGLRNENGNELNNVSFNKLFKSLSEDEIEVKKHEVLTKIYNDVIPEDAIVGVMYMGIMSNEGVK